MKKVALVFVVAVLVPSLVLAWLAVRSLRDQQFLLERQQSLLYQRVTDALATKVSDRLAWQQQQFGVMAEMLAGKNPRDAAVQFDNQLRKSWPLAEVGFCVTLTSPVTCTVTCPTPAAGPEALKFLADNGGFLGNREAAEVYWNANIKTVNQPTVVSAKVDPQVNIPPQQVQSAATVSNVVTPQVQETKNQSAYSLVANSTPASNELSQANSLLANSVQNIQNGQNESQRQNFNNIKTQPRVVNPQIQNYQYKDGQAQAQGNNSTRINNGQSLAPDNNLTVQNIQQPQQQGQKIEPNNQIIPNNDLQAQNSYAAKSQARQANPQGGNNIVVASPPPDQQDANLSKVVSAEAEFRQLVGDQTDGMLARFLQNKLKLMFWHRLNDAPDLIFGAQLNLNRVIDSLRDLVQADPELRDEIAVALLDDNAKPMTISRDGFQANWKRPFVASEIGEALPHWEIAAYLVNPAGLTQAAHTARLTLGLLIAVLVLAIGVGSWLIVASLGTELKLARQKTDFVSNVSHELKTPLTSIRMFSELLAEGRVTEPAKQRSYLNIITAEAARLTRLINNVLDFSRMESGEKKYNFQPCDLAEIARNAEQTFRPHLEANGFRFECDVPASRIAVRGDGDALSQIIVNLLSNAEKYSNGHKEIALQLSQKQSPLPYIEIKVLDRGAGVPRDCAEKIFEKFYRAHDSLSSGIQGSGLGLTIARQIARAHGGDVVYESREGGGSCFSLRIPVAATL